MGLFNNTLDVEAKKFTIKRMLKAIFKKKVITINRKEDGMETAENTANEKIYQIEYQDEEKQHDMIPVNYISTEHGTFFWTTENSIEPDADLIQPLYCCTSSQLALAQFWEKEQQPILCQLIADI